MERWSPLDLGLKLRVNRPLVRALRAIGDRVIADYRREAPTMGPEEWRQAETRFVSDPSDATRAAERIVERVLAERGYPTDGDTEEQAAHIAADYPEIVDRYRHAESLLAETNGGPSTENLRKAMVDFRAVLEELLVREPVAVHEEV